MSGFIFLNLCLVFFGDEFMKLKKLYMVVYFFVFSQFIY